VLDFEKTAINFGFPPRNFWTIRRTTISAAILSSKDLVRIKCHCGFCLLIANQLSELTRKDIRKSCKMNLFKLAS